MKNDTRPWYDHAVIYEIYPLSFKDSDGDGMGDLSGVISKLDYLKWLGVDAIWLTPFFTSPMKDFGYDISDYKNVDPRFGSLEIIKNLFKEAHARDIKVLIDLVTNHTSSEHPWFVESKSSKDNPKRDWYVWRDPGVNGGLPNNWLSVSGGPAWTYDEKSGQYYLHQFLPDQPDLNWRNAEVKKAMKDVMEFWIAQGVDGFRIDAISHMVEDIQFRDEPFVPFAKRTHDQTVYDSMAHIYSQNQPELKEVIIMFSEIAFAHKDIFLVSEAYLPAAGLLEFYRACPHHNHAPFNFNLLKLPWKAQAYRAEVDVYEKALNPEDVRPYVLGNHDVSRLASRIGREHTPLAAMLLLTLPGSKFVYYGEEIGMEDTVIPEDKIQDNFSRDKKDSTRDQSRTPMQWDNSTYAGFSNNEPWLPVNESKSTYNVATETKDPSSLLNLYKKLIALSKSEPALQYGTYTSFDVTSHHVFAFERSYEKEKVFVYLNFKNESRSIVLPEGSFEIILSTNPQTQLQSIEKELVLASNEGVIVRKK